MSFVIVFRPNDDRNVNDDKNKGVINDLQSRDELIIQQQHTPPHAHHHRSSHLCIMSRERNERLNSLPLCALLLLVEVRRIRRMYDDVANHLGMLYLYRILRVHR